MNIKRKILFLNLATLVPTIFFITYLNISNLQGFKKIQIENLQNVAKLVALENDQVIQNVRHLLITVSLIPETQTQGYNCDKLLANMLTKYQRYGNFGVTDSLGNVICSAVPTANKINLSDRFFFKETVTTNNFSTGEYVISKTTNKSSINFGYPRQNRNGVVYATLNLDWLNNLIANLDIDKNLIVLIADKNGVILANYPTTDNNVGTTITNKDIVEALTTGKKIIETVDADKVERIYALESLNEKLGPYILVGQTKKDIFLNPSSKFLEQSIIALIILSFSIILGLLVGRSLIENTVQKLKEIDDLRKDFISLISHQIRTPATSIRWFIEILLSGSEGKLNKKQKSILKDSYVATKKLIDLVSTVLNITKLETGKIKLQKEKIMTKKFINDILKSAQKEFRLKNIKTKLTISKNVPNLVSTDFKLMYQAIFNIIHNAFKYSYDKGLVHIRIQRSKDNLNIRIKDEGIGIPEQELKDLFQKFFRASNTSGSNISGTGLGLYLSKLIINAHGGSINFIKQKRGTLVLVTIPLR